MVYIDPDDQIYVPILQKLCKSEYICHLSEFWISGYATMGEEAQIWRDNWAIASELLSVDGRPVQTLRFLFRLYHVVSLCGNDFALYHFPHCDDITIAPCISPHEFMSAT
jgi:hypothetical protein